MLALLSLLLIGGVWWSTASLLRTGHADAVTDVWRVGVLAVVLGLVLDSLRTWMEDVLSRERAAAAAAHRAERQRNLIAGQRASLAALVASEPLAVIATDELGHVTELNPAAESLTGWRSTDARFRPVSEIVDLDMGAGAALEEMLNRAVRHGETFEETADVAFVSRHGHRRNAAVAVAPIRARASARRSSGGAQTEHPLPPVPSVYGAVISIRLLPSDDEEAIRARYTKRFDAFQHIARLAVDSLPSVRGADSPLESRPLAASSASTRPFNLPRHRYVRGETELWLKFTSPQSVAAFSLSALLRDVAEILTKARGEPVAVVVEGAASELPDAYGDIERLQGALIQLASALPHALDTGSLTASARLVEVRNAVRGFVVGMLAPGPYHRIDMDDGTRLVDREELLRKFDPMACTVRQEAIAALHLVAAYHTIRQHGGALGFGMNTSGSSALSVYLPVAPPSTLSWRLPSR